MVKREKGNQEEKLRESIKQGLEASGERFGKVCDRIMREARSWDEGFGTTHRKNGEIVVGSNRNIVDTGGLMGSREVTVQDDNTVEVTWESDHANAVYYGQVTENGTQIPGRPWAAIAKEEFDFAEEMRNSVVRQPRANATTKSSGGSVKKRNKKSKETVRYKV